MALLKSNTAKGIIPMPTGKGSDLLSHRMVYDLEAALALNDIIEMGDIPVDHIPVDCILDSDDLDTNATPLITLSVGVLNAGKTDLDTSASSGGAAWIAASTVAQAGGLERPSTVAITRAAARASTPTGDTPAGAQLKAVGVKVAAAPATGATTGKVGLTLFYRPANRGA